MSGLFISFEGGDGSGKSTQARALASWLEDAGYDVVLTREPGGTELGQAIRQLLLHGDDMGPRAEALLFAADRSHHVESLIRPALERGAVVISDRYFDSSVAYQGAARELELDEVRGLSMWATAGLLPDVTVLVDGSVAVGIERVGDEKDRLESEGAQFQDRVRAQFRELAQAEPERFVVVNGEGTIAEIAAQLRELIEPMLAEVQTLAQARASVRSEPAPKTVGGGE